MVLPFESLLPLPAATSPADQLSALSQLKHGIIGQTSRKVTILRSGGAKSLVKLFGDGFETGTDETLLVCVEAATILGALSLPTVEATFFLLESNAHRVLVGALETISIANDFRPNRFKLLESILRSIKSLYVDLVKVCGPRTWGTNVVGVTMKIEEITSSEVGVKLADLPLERSGSSEGMDGVIQAESSTTAQARYEALQERAIKDVYELHPPSSPSTSPPSTSKPTRTEALHFLQSLLIECASLDERRKAPTAIRIPVASRLRIADMICTFFAGTVRLPYQRKAAVGELGDDICVLRALYRLVVIGNGKVQEAALNALSALCRDHIPAATRLNAVTAQYTATDASLSDPAITLARSTNAPLRLAAITLQVVIRKTLGNVRLSQCEYLVRPLLELIETEPASRANATFTLAYLLADSNGLQTVAIKLKTLDRMRDILQQPGRADQPYPTPASLEDSSRVSEGALLVVASISVTDDTNRSQVLGAQLLPIIVASLTHASAGVRAAACHCIRGLARSVSVLRTSLIDTGAVALIYNLMRDDEDLIVQITVTAAVSNLILEFSPVRQTLLDLGCIARLCSLTRSPNHTLRFNALWALKNACFQSKADFKRATIEAIGWDNLGSMISGSSEEVSLEALAILRNLVCNTNNSQPITGLRELGEDRMLSLLETSMISKSDAVIEQAVYIVVNLASGDEASKLAIVARNKLLRVMSSLFYHPNPEIRSAAVWIVINLTYRAEQLAYGRKPIEIVSKLRAFGVEDKLRTMQDDAALNVRERVRDALKAMSLV